MKRPAIALFVTALGTSACTRPPGTPDQEPGTSAEECDPPGGENPCPGTPAPNDTGDEED